MIYFDNAASTYPKPQSVLLEVYDFLRHNCANPGRSGHFMSIEAAERVYSSREKIANFIGLKRPERISFTLNATHALNIAIKGLLRKGDHVIISDLEHNSVIRPLLKVIKERGGSYSVYNSGGDVRGALESVIRSDSALIITTLSSNVTGKVIDIKTVCEFAKEKGIKVVADGSQLLGHRRFDMEECGVDALCCAGHKALFGLQGVGFIAINDDTLYETVLEGGSGSNSLDEKMPSVLPERYEAGTLPTPSIISIGAGIDFIVGYGILNIERKIEALTQLIGELLGEIDGVKLYGCENGICSFNLEGVAPYEVGNFLNENSVYVRTGLHCSPLIHKKLGIEKEGSVRISLSVFNTEKELKRLRDLLFKLKQK